MVNLSTITRISGNRYKKTADVCSKLMKRHMHSPMGRIVYPFYCPCTSIYLGIYDWDNYFHAIMLSFEGDFSLAKNGVLQFLREQRPDGHTPRYVESHKTSFNDQPWDKDMCKPFLAQTLLHCCKGNDLEGVDYQRLKRFIGWWEKNRQTERGLFKWRNGPESGMDDEATLHPEQDKNKRDNWGVYEAVSCSSYMVREYEAMATIAQMLGNDEDSQSFREKASHLKKAVNNYMWHEEDEFYYNIDTRTGKKLRIRHLQGLTTLWAEIPSQEMVASMIPRWVLSDRHFWRPYGICSIDYKDNHYHNDGNGLWGCNWNGPVWMPGNYMVMEGLIKYGYCKEAKELAIKSAQLVRECVEKTGTLNEYFDGEKGMGFGAPEFGGWSVLGLYMPAISE